MKLRKMQIANGIATTLFGVGALLQWNDPDPLRWILLYCAAMISCVAWATLRRGWLASLLTAGVAIVWASAIWWTIPQSVSVPEMFEPMQTKGGSVEMAREIGGLSIICLWMSILVWVSLRFRTKQAMAFKSSSDDAEVAAHDLSSGVASDAQTVPRPQSPEAGHKSPVLWLTLFAVIVIGASVFGGYWLAVRTDVKIGDGGGTLVGEIKDQSDARSPVTDGESIVPELAGEDSAAAKNTGIDITVSPVGAKVSLDGHYLGQAPLGVRNLLPGSHTLQVSMADGTMKQEREIILTLGESRSVFIELENSPAAEGKRTAAASPDPNRKRTKDQRPPENPRTKVQGTEAVTISFGTLMLGSKPPCEIEIDGKKTGKSTPQRSIQLPEGLHKVVLTNKAQGIVKSFKVRIKAGRTTRAIQDFRSEL